MMATHTKNVFGFVWQLWKADLLQAKRMAAKLKYFNMEDTIIDVLLLDFRNSSFLSHQKVACWLSQLQVQ